MNKFLLFGLFVGFLLFGCVSDEKTSSNTAENPTELTASIEQSNTLSPTLEASSEDGCKKELYDDCSKITSLEKRNQCFNIAAANDLDCCFEIIGGSEEPYQLGSVSVMVNMSFRNRCILNKLTLAVYSGEKRDFCKRLENVSQYVTDWCYKDKYWRLGSRWCDNIQNVSVRDDCYLKAAR